MLWLTLLTFLAMFIGYGQMEAGFPAYARQVAEVSTRVIGLSFAVNTAVIVLLQFAVLARITGDVAPASCGSWRACGLVHG